MLLSSEIILSIMTIITGGLIAWFRQEIMYTRNLIKVNALEINDLSKEFGGTKEKIFSQISNLSISIARIESTVNSIENYQKGLLRVNQMFEDRIREKK